MSSEHVLILGSAGAAVLIVFGFVGLLNFVLKMWRYGRGGSR